MEASGSGNEPQSAQASAAEVSSSQEQDSPSRRAETSRTKPVPAKGKGLKRKADSITDDKRKKKKRKNSQRTIRPNYTVQEGEDMLLIISNISSGDSVWKPKRKVCKKKKKVNAKGKNKTSTVQKKRTPAKIKVPKVTEATVDKSVDLDSVHADGFDRWGQSLPIEILVKIFQFAVLRDGAVPFLCR